MKAILHTKYRDINSLKISDVQKPTPKADELLVKVHSSSVNRTDCAMLNAYPFVWRFYMGILKPKNYILGTEFAGKVVETGSEVRNFNVGNKVFGFHDQGLGAHAEYLCISEKKAVNQMPENIDYSTASTSIEGTHYAINFLNKVKLNAGDKVLINGACGGIGSALLQLSVNMGANVTAVCDTKTMELMQSLGATTVIDYTRDDFTKTREKYDFVFDSVGKSTFGKCKPILKPNGVYISSELGPGMQNVFYSLLTPITSKFPWNKGKKVKFPIPTDVNGSVKSIKELIELGKFKPVIDRVYSIDQVKEAFSYVDKGLKTGNVVLSINSKS